MVTILYHAPVNVVMILKIDGLNFDGLAGKHQKRQNFPVKILHYMAVLVNWRSHSSTAYRSNLIIILKLTILTLQLNLIYIITLIV